MAEEEKKKNDTKVEERAEGMDFRSVADEEKKAETSLVDAIGDLYSSLPQERIPELADHMGDMKTARERVAKVLKALDLAIADGDKKADENKKLADANTKLMFDQLKSSGKSEETKKEESDDKKIDDALDKLKEDED